MRSPGVHLAKKAVFQYEISFTTNSLDFFHITYYIQSTLLLRIPGEPANRPVNDRILTPPVRRFPMSGKCSVSARVAIVTAALLVLCLAVSSAQAYRICTFKGTVFRKRLAVHDRQIQRPVCGSEHRLEDQIHTQSPTLHRRTSGGGLPPRGRVHEGHEGREPVASAEPRPMLSSASSQ